MNRFTTIVASIATLCLTATFTLADTNLETTSNETGAVAELSNEASEIGTCGTPDGTGLNGIRAVLKPALKFVPIELPVTGVILAIPTYKPGDITGDGMVNMDDMLIVINAWGHQPKDHHSPADLAPKGGNQIVNLDDLLVVITNWGM